MPDLTLLILEDEPEVRDALERDLLPFTPVFHLEIAEDVPDAEEVLASVREAGGSVALILADHRMPGESGVDFLIRLHADPTTRDLRKVLLTGQADQHDTIRAINEAEVHHYIAKPWTSDHLHQVVRDQLTAYVIAHEDDLLPYLQVLDAPRLLEATASRSSDS